MRAAKLAIASFERHADQPDNAEAVAAQVARCFDSDDYKAGRRAFLDKRPPHFTGR